MNPICPSCGYRFDHDAAEGQLYRCPRCREFFHVGDGLEHVKSTNEDAEGIAQSADVKDAQEGQSGSAAHVLSHDRELPPDTSNIPADTGAEAEIQAPAGSRITGHVFRGMTQSIGGSCASHDGQERVPISEVESSATDSVLRRERAIGYVWASAGALGPNSLIQAERDTIHKYAREHDREYHHVKTLSEIIQKPRSKETPPMLQKVLDSVAEGSYSVVLVDGDEWAQNKHVAVRMVETVYAKGGKVIDCRSGREITPDRTGCYGGSIRKFFSVGALTISGSLGVGYVVSLLWGAAGGFVAIGLPCLVWGWYLGIPGMYALAAIGAGCCVVDLFDSNWRHRIPGLALAVVLMCCLSLGGTVLRRLISEAPSSAKPSGKRERNAVKPR